MPRATDGPVTRRKRWAIRRQRYGSSIIVCIALFIAFIAVKVAGDANDNAKAATRAALEANANAQAATKAATRATALAEAQVQALIQETAERRDQSCKISEQKQRGDVDQLKQTYDFLTNPPPGLENLVPIALTQLPQVEREAKADDAPAFCDEPGVGEPEPDPKLPKRPKGLPELSK